MSSSISMSMSRTIKMDRRRKGDCFDLHDID